MATVAPSTSTFSVHDAAPHALTIAEIKQIQQDFAAAAKRAVEAGFELIEVHAAHGYLLHNSYRQLQINVLMNMVAL